MMTTAGSLALLGHRAEEDAFVVGRLREAGAVILGKTNLSEWANFRSTRSSSGWSSRGGQTRNPYALDRNPCGSSSGSGVAVAANWRQRRDRHRDRRLDRLPRRHQRRRGRQADGGPGEPLGHRAHRALAGHRRADGAHRRGRRHRALGDRRRRPARPVTEDGGGRAALDYRSFLQDDGVLGARIGVARDYFGRHEGSDDAAERALATLRELGAEIVEDVDLRGVSGAREQEIQVMLYEFKAGLNAYLAEHRGAPVRSLEEVIAFNEAHAERTMPYFRQELLLLAQAKGGLDEGAYLEARAECLRRSRDEGIDAALRDHRLDAIVAPTTTPAWAIDPIDGDRRLGLCSSPAAMAGYPHVTVPAGFVHGLPVGLSFFGGAYEEGKLLAYAHAFERAAGVLRAPTFPERVA
jgi:amidase